jgi:hypothetical protein
MKNGRIQWLSWQMAAVLAVVRVVQVRYCYEGGRHYRDLQCNRCPRQSGPAFQIGVIFPKEAVTIEGHATGFGALSTVIRVLD